jgi:stress-induced morphogen
MAKITNNLLKQAIADAEAVRETAVANAKLVLEEAITPQIRDMIARRLRVEAMEGEEKEDKEEVKKESVGLSEPTEESAKELPFQDADAVGSSEFPADSSTVGTGDNKQPSADSFDASGIGDGGENKEDSHTDWYDDWSESDFDLDEVIKELEEDIARLAEAEHEEGEEKHAGEGEPGHEAGETGDEEHAEMKKEGWKKDEVSHETHDSDVQKFGKAPVTEEPGMGAPAGAEAPEGEEEELDLEAILAELEADDEEGHAAHGGMDKTQKMAAHLAGLKKELAQHRAVINTLRERLQEVNLLNSKLLFTNRIFRKEGLTNEQKVRIVESFDRATTVREVKLVYAALVENLSTAAKTFNASRKKIVAEGLASKATPSTAPKKDVIVENTVAKRLQELAGII